MQQKMIWALQKGAGEPIEAFMQNAKYGEEHDCLCDE